MTDSLQRLVMMGRGKGGTGGEKEEEGIPKGTGKRWNKSTRLYDE